MGCSWLPIDEKGGLQRNGMLKDSETLEFGKLRRGIREDIYQIRRATLGDALFVAATIGHLCGRMTGLCLDRHPAETADDREHDGQNHQVS